MSSKALLDHFSALEDPRQSRKVVYPLSEVMLLVLCAPLAAAEDFVEVRRWGFVEVRRWGEEKLAFLRTMLPFAHGIPSHDTERCPERTGSGPVLGLLHDLGRGFTRR